MEDLVIVLQDKVLQDEKKRPTATMNAIIVANWATSTEIVSFRIRDLTEVSIHVEKKCEIITKAAHG